MDKIVSAAKDYLQDDKESSHQQQSSSYNQSYESQQNPLPGSNKPAGGLASFLGDLDFNKASDEATKHAGSSGDSSLFSSILSSVGQKQQKIADEDLDEEDAINKHKNTYDQDDGNNDERSLGTAAAMQALKLFNKGETSNNSHSAFLGLAMSEASKLFDQKSSEGKVPTNASKSDTVQQAAEMAMKLFFKSKGDEQQGGLMGMASKYMMK